MQSFPKMIYKKGGPLTVQGIGDFSSMTVGSEEELAEAIKGGWHEGFAPKKAGTSKKVKPNDDQA